MIGRPPAAAILLALLVAAPPLPAAQDPSPATPQPRGVAWKPAPAPLLTRWAADVSPERVHPEYPRPQMVRAEWQNLNGLWDYAIQAKDAAAPGAYAGKILVPFAIESALSGVGKNVDAKSRLWYRRTFEVPDAWAGRRVLLHFGAVDWEATVLVNGRTVGTHRGGYDAFVFDVTPALAPSGTQEVVVAVHDATGGLQPRGKQTPKPGGIFYTATTGIWQTVWIEPVPESRIDHLAMTPDVDAGALRLVVAASGEGEVEAIAKADGKEVARIRGKGGETLVLPVPDARLWSPDDPFLYDLEVTLSRDGAPADSVISYFGMRKVALGRDEMGVARILLNGKPVFPIGPLDQGYWPDGGMTAPTDEALRYDVEVTRELGFNATRKHVKVEPERWYWWCDKLGLLVWQDMPSGDDVPGKGKREIERSPESAAQLERELEAMLEGRRNHPSIVLWVVFNEGWGQWDTVRLARRVKDLDPSRLVDAASGWHDFPAGDLRDMHAYPGPGSPGQEEGRAAVLGEFGGLGLPVEGHTWSKQAWGYEDLASAGALTDRYVALMAKVWRLRDVAALAGAIYTQLTDVETETNGLLTYDRAVIKVDAERVRAANRGEIPPLPPARLVLPTAERGPVAWRYTVEKPAKDWAAPDFDASGWKEGPAGFGASGTPGAIVRSEWTTPDIWLRREFSITRGLPADPRLVLHHDEDAEVYVNGVLAAKAAGYVGSYEDVEMTPEGRAAFREGRNVVAVHCRQTRGGQYIDVGIVDGGR